MMGDGRGQFQISDCNVASRIGIGDEPTGESCGEALTSQERLDSAIRSEDEVNATNALPRCVDGVECHWGMWKNLSDLGGAFGKRGSEARAVVQKIVDAGAEAEPGLGVGVPTALLEGAEVELL
jgi:hypothetical protein